MPAFVIGMKGKYRGKEGKVTTILDAENIQDAEKEALATCELKKPRVVFSARYEEQQFIPAGTGEEAK